MTRHGARGGSAGSTRPGNRGFGERVLLGADPGGPFATLLAVAATYRSAEAATACGRRIGDCP
jgi:hypothetical protein